MRTKRLTRNMLDRTLGGVCGGLGLYLGINPWWVRLLFLLFGVFTLGVSAILYLVLWLLIPPQTIHEMPTDESASAETLIILGFGVMGLGLVVLAVSLGILQGERGDVLLPFVIIGLGVVMLAQQLRKTV